MAARGSPSHCVFHIQEADHTLLILLIDRLIRLVKFGRHSAVKVTDVDDRCCWMGDETPHSALHDLPANCECYAEKQS